MWYTGYKYDCEDDGSNGYEMRWEMTTARVERLVMVLRFANGALSVDILESTP